MPYIPEPETVKKPTKAAQKPKTNSFDEDEFEGVSTGSLEYEKEVTFSQSQDRTRRDFGLLDPCSSPAKAISHSCLMLVSFFSYLNRFQSD